MTPNDVIAFTTKDYGADAGTLAPTLRAGGHVESHLNGGVQVGVVYTPDPDEDTQPDMFTFRKVKHDQYTTDDVGGTVTVAGHNNITDIVAGVLGEKAHTLTSEGHDASEDGTGRGTPVIVHAAHVAPCLRAGNPYNNSDPNMEAQMLVATRPDDNERTAAGFMHTASLDIQYADERTPTMKAGHDTTPAAHITTNGDVSVRRLTPVETERLQGFPDGHTEGQADSHRYKQMGNAVSVPVATWVGLRLMDAEAWLTMTPATRPHIDEPEQFDTQLTLAF